jgi:hypothetical protein
VGSWTHFSVRHLVGVGFPQVESTGDTCLLGLATGKLLVFDWEMEKWFHLRIGDEGFGLVVGRVADLGLGFENLVLGRHTVLERRKKGNFD